MPSRRFHRLPRTRAAQGRAGPLQPLARARSWRVGGGRLRARRAHGPTRERLGRVATTALPAEVQKIFRRTIPTGIDHGTVTVLLGGDKYEVTTLRGESGYADGRRPDVVTFGASIDEDLGRRDFTVNAIAYQPIDDELVDPWKGESRSRAAPAPCRARRARALRRGWPARAARRALRRHARLRARPGHRGRDPAEPRDLREGLARARARGVAQGVPGERALARVPHHAAHGHARDPRGSPRRARRRALRADDAACRSCLVRARARAPRRARVGVACGPRRGGRVAPRAPLLEP
jgi:hypothetical protein